MIQFMNKSTVKHYTYNVWTIYSIDWNWSKGGDDFKKFKFKINNVVYTKDSAEFQEALKKELVWEQISK